MLYFDDISFQQQAQLSSCYRSSISRERYMPSRKQHQLQLQSVGAGAHTNKIAAGGLHRNTESACTLCVR